MAIKYVSGRTRELKVGLSSYSEGKASLQVTGNVGVGTTNPLSIANPSNTSVISAGIVTANNFYGNELTVNGTTVVGSDIVTRNLKATGISTFNGDVHVSAAGTVGFGSTVYFGDTKDFKIWQETYHSQIETNDQLKLISYAEASPGIRSECQLILGSGLGTIQADLVRFSTSSGTLLETEVDDGGYVKLAHGASNERLRTTADGIKVVGVTSTQYLNVTGVSTFTDDINANGNIIGDSSTNISGIASITLSSHIAHTGDTSTKLAFGSGVISLVSNGNTLLTVAEIIGGTQVNDNLNVDGDFRVTGVSTFNNDVEFIGDAAGITSAFWDKSANELKFYDGSKITLGDGQDLELSHNGTDSLIRDSRASGSVLRIGADKLWLQNKDGNEPYLEATDNGSVKLYHDFLPRLETTGIGITIAGVGSTAYIEGPDNIIIDPHPYGIGATSGNVFIRGDLYVEGTEFIVDVDKIELGDFQIGIATTAGTNALLDGAGIGIGSTNIRKFITWNNATNALMTSENWNLASGKHYEINGVDVLTSNTLLVGTGASVHSPSNNILTLHTNGAEKLRIDATGNLGIGTATPTDPANAANTSVTSAGIVTANQYYGTFLGSIPGFSTVFSSGQGSFSATPGSPYTIDTFAFASHDYEIAEYTLHFVHANGLQAQKTLVIQNNSTAYSNEYGILYDSELLVSIGATISGGNVNITATPETGISGLTTFRWRREVQT